ncbi:MAG: hypothetical protein L3K18_04895, partial [Thermoplasmata archaeon]|nr:hypothetical protein [Thermoplasmata archaeon]
MKALGLVLAATVAILLLAVVPIASAAPSNSTGTATSCGTLTSCHFTFTSGNLTGWANTYSGSVQFQLPGEANVTANGHYSVSVVNVSGTTDHVLGTIVAIDANSGKVVFGSTDTNITVTVHCSHTGCGTTYHLLNGTMRLRVTNTDGTSTAVACSPSSFSAGSTTRCTATVTDLANHSVLPSGSIQFSTFSGLGALGTFSHHGACTLVSGSCSVRFTAGDETVGSF